MPHRLPAGQAPHCARCSAARRRSRLAGCQPVGLPAAHAVAPHVVALASPVASRSGSPARRSAACRSCLAGDQSVGHPARAARRGAARRSSLAGCQPGHRHPPARAVAPLLHLTGSPRRFSTGAPLATGSSLRWSGGPTSGSTPRSPRSSYKCGEDANSRREVN